MVGASALMAVTSLLAKALGRGVGGLELHPLQVTAGRFWFALAGLALVSVWLRPGMVGVPWGLHAARTLSGWLGVTCMFAAAARMPLAEATAITFLSPLATMALALPMLGERMRPIRWLAAAIAMIGALLLIRPGAQAFEPAALVALAAALFMGLEVIFIKQLSSREPPIRILLINNAMGALISGAAVPFVWIAPTPSQWAMLILLGLVMACAQVLFIQAMRAAEAGHVAPVMYATLVFAAFYDLAVFGDLPDLLSQIGMVVILTGLLLLASRPAASGEVAR
ncbi:MAG TPA: DMT family transporter [Hyphomicrobiaceae bacterium]|nr:DMT family transporter [Hyphomicrobiaceae bacterium]